MKVRPSASSQAMMKVFSIIMTMAVVGMMVAAISNGLFEEGGAFGVVWVLTCVAIAGFGLTAAFRRKWAAGVTLEIEHDGDDSPAGEARDVDTRLRTLDELKRKGLVTEEECRRQRERIIRSI